MMRIQADPSGPCQDMAIEIIKLASEIYEQGNTLTVRWCLNARSYGQRNGGHFRKESGDRDTEQLREYILEPNRGKETFNLPKHSSKRRIRASL